MTNFTSVGPIAVLLTSASHRIHAGFETGLKQLLFRERRGKKEKKPEPSKYYFMHIT